MKVKLKDSVLIGAENKKPGDVVDVPDLRGAALIKSGSAEEVKDGEGFKGRSEDEGDDVRTAVDPASQAARRAVKKG